MTDDLYERYKEALRVGHVAVLRGALEDAVAAYRAAALIAPSRAIPHTSLGGVFLRLGHLEEALSEYTAAVELAPHDEGALLGQAEALATAGQRVGAALALDHVSEIQEAAGRLPEAADTLRRAVELDDSAERARRQRSLLRQIRLSAGDHVAEQLLARALRLRDESPGAAPDGAPAAVAANPYRGRSVESSMSRPASSPEISVTGSAPPAAATPTSGFESVTSGAPAVEVGATIAGVTRMPGPVRVDARPAPEPEWPQEDRAPRVAEAGSPRTWVRPAGFESATGAADTQAVYTPPAAPASEPEAAGPGPDAVEPEADAAAPGPEAAAPGPEAKATEPVAAASPLVPVLADGFTAESAAPAEDGEVPYVGVMDDIFEPPAVAGALGETQHPRTGDELMAAAEAAELAGDDSQRRSLLVWTARAYGREGRFEAGLDTTHMLLQRDPADVDAHLVLVELFMARGWSQLAAEKLVLLGRLAQLNNDEQTRQRLCAVASRAFPRDEQLGALCS